MTKAKRIWIAAGSVVGLLLCLAVTLILVQGSGEPGLVVTGIVKDAATGRPIAGAQVSDDQYGSEPHQSASTDSEGRYRYLTWHEEHTIVATAPGYKPQQRGLSTGLLQSEKEKVVDFVLEAE